jgi:hypothetical protein
MLGALAFSMGESSPRFLRLDLPIVQIAPGGVPERRLRNEGFQSGLCTRRAPATLDNDFVHTIAFCTHATSSYTVVLNPRFRSIGARRTGTQHEVADAACEHKQIARPCGNPFERDPKNAIPKL